MDLSASFLTLAELAEGDLEPGPADGHRYIAGVRPTPDDIVELRHYMNDGLAEVNASWSDRPDAPLRVTKRRLRTMSICPAQILSELDSGEINMNLAAGLVCDVAAGLLSINPRFPAEGGWFASMSGAIGAEHPHVLAFVDGLDPAEREEFEALIDERCAALPSLLGDISEYRPTSHERITVRFVDANVWLTAELDLAVGRTNRVLAEVKTGSYTNWIPEELRHYGLLVALRDGHAPKVGAAITLTDQRVSAVSLGLGELELAAKRVLTTARNLAEVDTAVREGRPVPTNPGDHCRWCQRLDVCPDAPDLSRADAELDGDPSPVKTTTEQIEAQVEAQATVSE